MINSNTNSVQYGLGCELIDLFKHTYILEDIGSAKIREYNNSMKKPVLIVLGGFAGAGKTTLSTKLSGQYNFPVFSPDVINDVLRSILNKEFHEVSPMSYDILWHLVKTQLQAGVTVILDANMCSQRVWDRVDELHEAMPDVQILPIILKCSLDTHRQRIEVRGRTNKEHLNLGGDSLDDVLFKYEFIEKLQRPDIFKWMQMVRLKRSTAL
jgi:deoxyadenosine/deoxycytidine kinase